MEYFIEQVTSWQHKLNTADSAIFTWMEVQRTWSHLESIFVCSEDVRIQLKEDARRFDEVDVEFKVCERQFSILAPSSRQYEILVKKCDLGYFYLWKNIYVCVCIFGDEEGNFSVKGQWIF